MIAGSVKLNNQLQIHYIIHAAPLHPNGVLSQIRRHTPSNPKTPLTSPRRQGKESWHDIEEETQ
jgi:hypothetical protein